MTDFEASQNDIQDTTEKGHVIPLKFGIGIDVGYAKSIEGILQAVIAVLSFIGFCCVAASRSDSMDKSNGAGAYNYFEFVSISSFLVMTILYILYLSTIYSKLILKIIPWTILDIGFCGFYIFMFFIASIVLAAKSGGDDGNKAGSVFGFFTLIALGGKGFLLFRDWRETRAESGVDKTPTGPDYDPEKY